MACFNTYLILSGVLAHWFLLVEHERLVAFQQSVLSLFFLFQEEHEPNSQLNLVLAPFSNNSLQKPGRFNSLPSGLQLDTVPINALHSNP